MRVRSIRYGRLRSIEGFNHVKLEKEVELEDGDDPEAVLNVLRAEVDEALGLEADYASLAARHDRLMGVVERAERRSRQLREEHNALYQAIDRAQIFVGKAREAGIEVPLPVQEAAEAEMPF